MSIFTILSFIIIVGAIWYYAWWRSRSVDMQSSDGMFLGGRSLTGITIAGTMILTNLSTEQIVGLNGQSYGYGMEVMAWEVTSALTLVLLALVFLPRYIKYGISTIPDYIEQRYDSTTKRIVSILYLLGYTFGFIPIVLYSGALIFNKLFHVDTLLNINSLSAILLIGSIIGFVGICYLTIGGMKLSAISDTIYGVGLLVGGLSIPILGVIYLGKGDFLAGMDNIMSSAPEKLNAIGAVNSKLVPWPTLFLGMFFNNLFYWCTNQLIVQRTLAGKSLAEGQKGALYASFFKIFGALFLVFPGIVAFHIYGDSIPFPDDAYPTLVATVLNTSFYGVFAAVIFGAILSSFNGCLNSVATLFSLDIYKEVINKKATEKQIVRMGRIIVVLVAIISICVAPLISFFPKGLYSFMQELNGFFSLPVLAIILVGFYTKYVPASAAKIVFIFHIILYTASKWVIHDVNFLYVWSVLFPLDVIVMLVIGKYYPTAKPHTDKVSNVVPIIPWKYAKHVSTLVVICMFSMYWLFSSWGIAG